MVEAIVLMNYLGGTGERIDMYKSVIEQLLKIPGVVEVFAVLGGYDLVARVRADNLDQLTLLIADKIRSVPGVQSSHTLPIIF